MAATPRIQLDEILPKVYDELRHFASRALVKERDSHSFQTTELVHETYVRLAGISQMQWTDKDHVLRAAIGVMRRVLIDHARSKNTKKRDRDQLKLVAPNHGFNDRIEPPLDLDLIALDEVLNKLAEFDSRKAEVVELKYFGGQDNSAVARLLGVSTATVKRDWIFARAWLLKEISS